MSREMGGALAPPFEHLVYICPGKELALRFARLAGLVNAGPLGGG